MCVKSRFQKIVIIRFCVSCDPYIRKGKRITVIYKSRWRSCDSRRSVKDLFRCRFLSEIVWVSAKQAASVIRRGGRPFSQRFLHRDPIARISAGQEKAATGPRPHRPTSIQREVSPCRGSRSGFLWRPDIRPPLPPPPPREPPPNARWSRLIGYGSPGSV